MTRCLEDWPLSQADRLKRFRSANIPRSSCQSRIAKTPITSPVLRPSGPRSALLATPFHCTKSEREIGRAHVYTPVTNAHLVCRLLLERINTHKHHVPTITALI